MKTICLHDKNRIEAFLRRDVYLNIYQLGDLDDHFWPHTTWYALAEGDEIQAIALVYTGLSTPTLLALGRESDAPVVRKLLESVMPLLPESFYAHLGPAVADCLADRYNVKSDGKYLKMALPGSSKLGVPGISEATRLRASDADELLDFFAESHPQNWFEPPMLKTNQYFGVRDSGRLVSVAGVHVYSEQHGVAALANIATRPSSRRSGYAKAAVAALCRNLLRTVDHIGLNVKADNDAAIGCYTKLGFEMVAEYEDCFLGPREAI